MKEKRKESGGEMKEKILIIEDELDLLDLLDFNLTRKGYRTSGAMDGEDALRKVESFGPDLVILDLMLPKMDGWEICSRIKDKNKEIFVVMVTAKCMPEDKVKGLETGADDYVTKPFNVKELIMRIDRLLEGKRRSEMKNMLFHEMSNRMLAIGCYSDLLTKREETISGERRAVYLNNIRKQVDYTAELISELNIFMELESGDLDIRKENCALRDIFTSLALARKNSKGNDVDIEFEMTGDPSVNANRAVLLQVFSNIIMNAIKYSGEDGRVIVSASTAPEAVTVTVKDNGCGIPEDELPFIFHKGFRASNVKKNTNGSGLGLYIVGRVLEKMGAEIKVKSVQGEGSEFTVIFRQVSKEEKKGFNAHLTGL